MKERIIKLRKDNNLSQEKFAERIGLSRNFINQVETGKKNFSDRTVSDICREFSVNEAWLRNGLEPMYKEKDGEFSELVSELEDIDDDFIKNLITIYMELDEDSKKALRKIAEGLAKKYRD